MSPKSKQGFASASPEQHQAASAKGGSSKVPKGLAKLSPERRKEIATLGGKKMWENKLRKEHENHGNNSTEDQSSVTEQG